MNYNVFFFLLIIIFSCKSKKVILEQNIIPLSGKVINEKIVGLESVEVSSNDYLLKILTDENGNYKILNRSFIKDFRDGYDILISLKKNGYKTKNVVINNRTHIGGDYRIKFFTMNSLVQKEILVSKEPIKEVVVSKVEAPKTENTESKKEIYTEINVEEVINEKDGTINFGNVTYDQSTTVNEGDNTTIINETKIIKDTKIIEIPFEERECGKKEIGYLLIKNTYNEGINTKITTYGPKKSQFALGFENYSIASNSEKILRLQSGYYYGFDGEKFSEKWSGTFVYGFKDGFFINSCDTVSIVTP